MAVQAFVFGNASALAVGQARHVAGAASAVLGVAQAVAMATAAPLASSGGGVTAVPMIWVMIAGVAGPADARASLGVEHLSPLDRVAMVLEAGCDQFGGEACPELVVELVRAGRISEDRIDLSVRRLLLEKFRLGLFDQRYVDVDAASAVVGRADFVEAGLNAQRASYTLLINNDDILPLNPGLTVYVEGVDASGAGGVRQSGAGPSGGRCGSGQTQGAIRAAAWRVRGSLPRRLT